MVDLQREDLVAFVMTLSDDFARRGSTWENLTLDRYVAALAR
jgi:hypothetical protein